MRNDTPGFRDHLRNFSYLGRLLAQIWRTSRLLTTASIGLRLLSAFQPVAALYVGKLIIDEVVRLQGVSAPGPDIGAWWQSGLLLPIISLLAIELTLVVAQHILAHTIGFADSVLAESHSNTQSVELMTHAARLDLTHFESAEHQDRLERARRQAAGRNGLLSLLFGQAQSAITVSTLAIGLFVYAPWLILLLPLSFLPAIWGEAHFNTLAYALYRRRAPQRRELDYLRHIGASAETAKETKLFGLGDFLVTRFKSLAGQILDEHRRIAAQRAFLATLFATLASLAYYGAYGFIVWRTVIGDFTIGDLAFLAGSFLRLNNLFQQILLGFTQLAGQSLYLGDLFSFFAIAPSIVPPPSPKPFPVPIQSGIVFENVGFRYPETDNWVVRNLSFTLGAGETLALVGENGAGKTTIVKLLTRLYDPSEGRITLDGVDLRQMDPSDIHRHIGVIFQDFLRYSFTARDNIGVGRIEARTDQSRIATAAERSLADSVISGLAKGYEQPLGRLFDKGRDLSGGEWQKIAIARAYMREAELIILDEPTAALDARAEAAVFTRFKSLAHKKSAIIISHRFSSVRMADRIVVLENGTVLEAGRHEDLLARRGRYAELFELQAAGYR